MKERKKEFVRFDKLVRRVKIEWKLLQLMVRKREKKNNLIKSEIVHKSSFVHIVAFDIIGSYCGRFQFESTFSMIALVFFNS